MTKAITSFYLRAEHWRLFLLLAVMPMLLEMAAIASMPMTPRSSTHFSGTALLFMAAMLFYAVCFLAWFWSLGSFLNSIVKPELKLRTAFFHFSLVYPAVYLPVFLALLDMRPAPVAVILPLHLLAMFCIFYVLRFASKALAMAETGRSVSFYDYAGAFFLLWFYPLGVWVVQPRVNRLYARHRKSVAA